MINYNYLYMNLAYDPYFGFLTFKMFPFFKLFAVFYFDIHGTQNFDFPNFNTRKGCFINFKP